MNKLLISIAFAMIPAIYITVLVLKIHASFQLTEMKNTMLRKKSELDYRVRRHRRKIERFAGKIRKLKSDA